MMREREKILGISRREIMRGAIALSATLLASKVTGCQNTDSQTSGESVKIGLVAATSGQSALSGEAITRGLTVAIEEINAAGGVLEGRKLELIARDDESTPAKGVAAARELIERQKVAIIFGGIDSPVSLAMLPVLHELKVPYMGVWAAATGITRNGRNPNYAFRVSANDNIVDRFLLKYVSQAIATTKVGLLLIDNPWGESNQAGFQQWSPEYNLEIVGIEKFKDSDTDISPQLLRLQAAQAGALLLVANAAPGAQVMKSLTRINWDVPVISHWGISGGRFPELAGSLADQVKFIQTYSFYGEQNAVGKKVLSALKEKYNLASPSDVLAPVGTANAYDALHLTALALETAGTTEGSALRAAFYEIPPYEGLIKTYNKPFTSDNHDALTEDDYILVQWKGNEIVPVDNKQR